jgi:hypothetical protein
MTDELHPRTLTDLRIRREIFGEQRAVEIPRGSEEFWTWYARTIRFGGEFELVPVDGMPEYPEPAREAVLWYSGGVESTYSLQLLRNQNPDLLSINDYEVFTGPDRKVGQIHFICAAIAAGLGYRTIYLGMERDDFLLSRSRKAYGYVERHPTFAARWAAYQPDHELRTVCGDLDKEEVIRWLADRGIEITGTCDNFDDGQWCGECYKCFEAFYFAKAVDIDLGIPLSRRYFSDYYGKYQRYVASGFTDNFNNSYHRFARLQMRYLIEFDPDQDCVR